ncbi:bacteriocin immunity protein [Pseudomonas sp. PSKL.D1]|uniref:bacteriocin immunity protein n=1 Tax=Pseudomonas sp. PSKL.D1 TaxID=3029060 RepID=UPI00238189F8|nr:bacteriocin immunity protein [Pseudomonas sp. PSKL.D1]WDY58872.1 bacteriocin immunity protein [Pseudomonas sp. PSKL.D1]
MINKTMLSEFTEAEFIQFIASIIDPEDGVTEADLDARIFQFKKISEHPSGSDLIFWPEDDGLDEPEEIVKIIKQWRVENGKTGFKTK